MEVHGHPGVFQHEPQRSAEAPGERHRSPVGNQPPRAGRHRLASDPGLPRSPRPCSPLRTSRQVRRDGKNWEELFVNMVLGEASGVIGKRWFITSIYKQGSA